MPRRRPDVLRGLSGRCLADLNRLERSRNYLWPGDVRRALEDWAGYLRSPARRLWLLIDDVGCGEGECCPNPFKARELLDRVVGALPRRSARELRERLEELDDL